MLELVSCVYVCRRRSFTAGGVSQGRGHLWTFKTAGEGSPVDIAEEHVLI